MDFANYIMIERPLEKVFLWMFQPHHIVQLITRDHTQDNVQYNVNDKSIPAYEIERLAKRQRFLAQAEAVIKIENLSTPTLQVGTTFLYDRGWKSSSEEFPAWTLVTTGTIIIKESVPPTFFSFATSRTSRSVDHRLTFQAQKEKTIMTYNRSDYFVRKIPIMIASALLYRGVSAATRKELALFRKESERQQLLRLKVQMETEID